MACRRIVVYITARTNNLVKNLLITARRTDQRAEKAATIHVNYRRTPCSLRGKITTHLHEGDEDDEERRRAARIVIGVVLSVPFLR